MKFLFRVVKPGGFLVPTQFVDTILSVAPQKSIIRPNATVIPAGDRPDAPLEIPYFEQDDEMGGIEHTHRKENEDMDESSPGFGLMKLEPKEYSTFVDVSKKSIENITAISAFLERRFGMSMASKEDYLFMNGLGGDKQPLGLLNSLCKILVDRNTSGQIKYADIALIMASMLDFDGAFWIINQKSMPSIMTLADSNGNSIFIQGDATKKISSSLLGFPIKWSSRVQSLGSEGDISFVNPNYYVIKDGSGPAVEIYDVQPKKRLLTFTSVWNVDAQCWVKEPITREDGEEYSPVIKLTA